MQDIDLLLAENESFKFVKVVFFNSQRVYTYKTLLEFEKGDFAIVDAPSSGLTAVEVVGVCKAHEITLPDNVPIKWIVQRVDTTRYKELIEKEQAAQQLLNTSRTKKLVNDFTETLTEQIGVEGTNELRKLTRL